MWEYFRGEYTWNSNRYTVWNRSLWWRLYYLRLWIFHERVTLNGRERWEFGKDWWYTSPDHVYDSLFYVHWIRGNSSSVVDCDPPSWLVIRRVRWSVNLLRWTLVGPSSTGPSLVSIHFLRSSPFCSTRSCLLNRSTCCLNTWFNLKPPYQPTHRFQLITPFPIHLIFGFNSYSNLFAFKSTFPHHCFFSGISVLVSVAKNLSSKRVHVISGEEGGGGSTGLRHLQVTVFFTRLLGKVPYYITVFFLVFLRDKTKRINYPSSFSVLPNG